MIKLGLHLDAFSTSCPRRPTTTDFGHLDRELFKCTLWMLGATDKDFYNYYSKFDGDDDHVTKDAISQLIEIGFPLGTGFSLDSMQTLLRTFKKGIEGTVHFKNEREI